MLSYLNPALLWALPLAGAPVVLHLIFMRRARRVPFSDLSLLKAAYARSLPSTRLRQWLILLLRCLVIAGLVLAFARPVFHPSAAVAGGAEVGLDILLLVDTSWSMGAQLRGKPRFDLAVGAGKALLRVLRPADRIAAAGFSDRLENEWAWAADAAAAEEAISRMRLGSRTTDAVAALESAYEFLVSERVADGPDRRRVIVLLSDGAAHSLKGMPAGGIRALKGFDPGVTLLGLAWDAAVSNAGIEGLQPGLVRGADKKERLSLSVRTALYGERRAGWTLDLFLRNRRVDQRTIDLSPERGRPVSFRLPPGRSAEHWGRVSLRRDSLAADDDYFFSLRVQPRPKVLLLYGSPNYLEAGRGGYFLKKLAAEGSGLPYQLDLADFGRLKQIELTDYRAVLLADFRRLPAGVPEKIKRFVVRGGGLWVLAGATAGEESYRDLRRVLPGRLGESLTYRGSGATIRPQADAIPAETRRGLFRWDEFELSQVKIIRRYDLIPKEKSAIWFRDSLGRPLMLAGRFGRGRVLLWASALDIRWSNLALKPVFAAWLDVGLRHLTRYTGRQVWRTLKVGEPIVREFPPGEGVPAKMQVRGPGGRRTTLLVQGRKVVFRDTRTPGIYFLQATGGGEDGSPEAYAVNLDRGGPEGDLSPAARPPWRMLRPDNLRKDFLRSVYGREIRTGTLAVVLLALLLEMLLARPRRKDDETRTAGRAHMKRTGVGT